MSHSCVLFDLLLSLSLLKNPPAVFLNAENPLPLDLRPLDPAAQGRERERGGGSGGRVRERAVAMAGGRCVGVGDSLSISERDLVDAP